MEGGPRTVGGVEVGDDGVGGGGPGLGAQEGRLQVVRLAVHGAHPALVATMSVLRRERRRTAGEP